MANPKRRHSNTRTRTRRAHDFLKLASLSKCANCGTSILAHRICPACGYYKGKLVIAVKPKEKKRKGGGR